MTSVCIYCCSRQAWSFLQEVLQQLIPYRNLISGNKEVSNPPFLCPIIPTASEYYAINLQIADIRLCRTQSDFRQLCSRVPPKAYGPKQHSACTVLCAVLVLRLLVEPSNTADESHFEFYKVGCQQFVS